MLTQEQLIAYLEGTLRPAERARVEELLCEDAVARQQLLDQQRIHEALRVMLANDAANERVKQSILAVVRGQSEPQFKAQVLEQTRAASVESVKASERPGVKAWVRLSVRTRQPVRRLADATLQRSNASPLQRLFRFGTTAAVLVLALGAYFYFHRAPVPRIEVGQFAAVMGTPKVQHAGMPSTLNPQPSTPVHFGDRIETGDADKVEIQFRDGITLRLNFNTTLEIPKPTLQRSNASTLQRPAEVKLLLGQIWSRVQKATNQTQFAVHTPVATAAVRGTEFGLKLQRLSGSTKSTSAIRNAQSAIPLEAVLTVTEGKVEFFNSFGKVEATPMTDSVATAGAAPTDPKRVHTLKNFRLKGGNIFSIGTQRPDLVQDSDRLVFPRAWSGLTLREATPQLTGQAAGNTRSLSEVHVKHVRRGSPADQAGLRLGDVIIAVEGQAVTKTKEVLTAVLLHPDTQITLNLLRAGEEKTVIVTPVIAGGWPQPKLAPGPEGALHEATRSLFQGSIDEGERALEQLLTTDASAAAHNNLGTLYHCRDEMGKAIQHLQQAVQQEPQVALYHVNLGMAIESIGNIERAIEEYETAAQLAPQWPGNLSAWLATAYTFLDRFDDAMNVVEAKLKLQPDNPGNWGFFKMQILLSQGRVEEAIQACLKAIELDPTLLDVYRTLATFYSQLGQLDEAEKRLRKANELDPTDPDVYLALGGLNLRRRQFDEAEKMFLKAIECDSGNAKAYLRLGDSYRERRQWEDAEKAYRRLLEIDPKSAGGHVGLADIYNGRQRYDEAIELYRKAIELEPEETLIYHNFAWLLHGRRRFEEAEQMWLKAIEADPEYSLPYRALGMLYQEQERFDKAEEFYRKAILVDPNNASFYVNLGNLYRGRRQFDEAEKLYHKATEINPSSKDAYMNLGELYDGRGDLQQAEAKYRKAIELNPDSKSAQEALAKFVDKHGRASEAEEIYRRLLETSPNDHRVPNWLARFLAGRGTQLDEALSLAQRAVQAEPQNPQFLDTLGWTHFKRRELAEAEATLKKALELFGEVRDAAEVWEHLGQVYEKKGDQKAALDAYRKALSLQPDNKEAKAALERLGQ